MKLKDKESIDKLKDILFIIREISFILFVISAIIYILCKSVFASDSREPFKSSFYYLNKPSNEIEEQNNFVTNYVSKYYQYIINPINKYSIIDDNLKKELLIFQIKSCKDSLHYSLNRPFLNEEEMIIIFNIDKDNLLSKFNYLKNYSYDIK